MASFQRAVISLLLILSIAFLFFAQSAEATKGPKITNKVCTNPPFDTQWETTC